MTDDTPTTVISVINMKGGVGKSTIAFNLAWYLAWHRNHRILAVDLDPQANLSQYFLGARKYREFLDSDAGSIVDIYEQFSSPKVTMQSPKRLKSGKIIRRLHEWSDGSFLDLLPSRLELARTLRNPTEKAHLLPRFLSKVADTYDLVFVDCDGNLDLLVPIWLEAGINGVWPIEVAAGMSPVALRQEYGRDLLLVGGIDKRELSKGREQVYAEVMAKVPYLNESGGYIPTVDHSVPPDVPLDNYLYFRQLLRDLA